MKIGQWVMRLHFHLNSSVGDRPVGRWPGSQTYKQGEGTLKEDWTQVKGSNH